MTNLIADIGGTNARFALCEDDGTISNVQIYPCKKFKHFADVVKKFITESKVEIKKAAMAIACPITGDHVQFTNCKLDFSILELQNQFKFEKLEIVNDFVAQAYAIPELTPDDVLKVGEGIAQKNATIGVIGPGTGLGVSFLVPQNGSYIAIPGEGGHATISATTNRQMDVLSILYRQFGHVSAERVISGQGLSNIYNALRLLTNEASLILPPEDIFDLAIKGDDLGFEAVNMMFDMLGTFSGNLALTIGAFGGIYIAGGIIPRPANLNLFIQSDFRKKFAEKGRFKSYLEQIPTFVMASKNPAFLGLSYLIKKM